MNETDNTITTTRSGRDLSDAPDMIVCSGVSKWYGDFQALENVSATIKEQEVVVVLGPSGSGKSTLIRCINGLEFHNSGTLTVDGIEVHAHSKKMPILRQQVGMVFQQFNLFPHLTVLENLTLGPVRSKNMTAQAAKEIAMTYLERVKIPEQAGKYPRQLSGGQQQRVGIARSLAIEPDIWFLDEPFSALDPLIRREMQDEFLRLQQLLNKTIVFITHDFDEALRLADRIAIMKDGAVEQCDTPDQIVLNPATEYVRKFTEEVDKARVVHAGVLVDPKAKGTGDPIDAKLTVHKMARMLVNDSRDFIPVTRGDNLLGAMPRKAALDILLGSEE